MKTKGYLAESIEIVNYLIALYTREKELDKRPYSYRMSTFNRNEMIRIFFALNNKWGVYNIQPKRLFRMYTEEIKLMVDKLIEREYNERINS